MPPKLPTSPTYDATGIQHHTIENFTFLNGRTHPSITVAYRSFNPSSTHGTILIPTCFSGFINNTLTFSQSPFDSLAPYHIVVAAMLSNGESSSPSNTPDYPSVGEQHYEDVIKAHHDLLTRGLGISQLTAVLGFSMGGQQAYHWAVQHPTYVGRIISICSSARTSAHNYAFLEGPIAALRNSEAYLVWKRNGSDPAKLAQPTQGLMAFGRSYAAWLTSAEWFHRRLWRTQLGFESVDAWIRGGREESVLAHNADDLLMNARMWQMGDIGATAHGHISALAGGTGDDELYHAALRGITCPVLLMPCRTDQYFLPEDNLLEAQSLRDARVRVIESCWGHIAGGGASEEDVRFMNAQIADFMASSSASVSS